MAKGADLQTWFISLSTVSSYISPEKHSQHAKLTKLSHARRQGPKVYVVDVSKIQEQDIKTEKENQCSPRLGSAAILKIKTRANN